MSRNIRCHIRTTKTNNVPSCEPRVRYGPYIVVSPDLSPNPNPPAPIDGVAIVPTVNRYYYIPQTPIDLTNGATFPSTLFVDDHENQVDEFSIFSPNGYVNLHINGVIQGDGFYEVDSSALTINPTTGIIRAGTPIIIESLGFAMVQNT